MKTINNYIAEKLYVGKDSDKNAYEPKYKSGFVSQWKKKKMTDLELLYEYWASWTGYDGSNNGYGGISSNSKATKLSEEIYNKYDFKYLSDGDPCIKLEKITDIVKDKFNIGNSARFPSNREIGIYAMQIIKNNLDWILCGEPAKEYEITK